ncbi:hypothetical protein DICVIV_03304 [Dictyocaulus viviparus]|uniref:Uncharacterized protein n=1 Tax=Dictyocaulus viviparus TaxID=29172 RepID=A0A0D8Y3D5_DICVI|nr:hypothetical protein DICVIV_03304 [Dictyocaulus viviparus]
MFSSAMLQRANKCGDNYEIKLMKLIENSSQSSTAEKLMIVRTLLEDWSGFLDFVPTDSQSIGNPTE